jgi:hypothetical protein
MGAWAGIPFELGGWGGWALAAAGLVCATLAFAAALSFVRRLSAEPPGATVPDTERRQGPRRATGVPVHISSAESLPEPIAGWVLNGSAGGLCLSVEQPVPRGAVLSVRPTKAPPGTPPVQVCVQRCKADRRRWALGCRFVQAPPAHVLGLFGG